MLNSRKGGRIIINAGKFTRQQTVMRVTHNKCGSLLFNVGELIRMLKSNIYY